MPAITDRSTAEPLLKTARLGHGLKEMKGVRPYGEYVDSQKRDNRLLEVEP